MTTEYASIVATRALILLDDNPSGSPPKMAIFSDLLYLNHSASLETTHSINSQTECLDSDNIF